MTGPEVAKLRAEVQQRGEHAARTARELAEEWLAWSRMLAELVESTPAIARLSYLDEFGEACKVESGLRITGITRGGVVLAMTEVLQRSDAVVADLQRQAQLVAARTAAALRELEDQEDRDAAAKPWSTPQAGA